MRLVIVGGVAAGLSAAARARRLDAGLDIVVLEKGDVISYGACGLPFLIEGRVRRPEDLVLHTPEQFASERHVTVRTGAAVVSIEHPRRQVVLEGGERVRYDRMVIATGARPCLEGIAGTGQEHVFTLYTLGDGARINRFLAERQPRRAVVIGAGYIGLEIADALRKRGLEVTVLEGGAWALNREDAALTKAVAGELARHGVELRLNVRVEAIEPGRVGDFPCDMAVLAPGIRPNTALAAEAGIQCGRTGAIQVDDHMATNLAGVFAAGDCAETRHLVTERPAWVPLGPAANKMGRVAGANAAGRRERFAGVAGTAIVRVFDLGIAVTGLSEQQARREGFAPVAARIEAPSRPAYFEGQPTTVELVADRGSRRLLGGSVVGRGESALRINVIAAALHGRLRAEEFEALDLAYAPPFSPVWDPLLIAAQQLTKALAGR